MEFVGLLNIMREEKALQKAGLIDEKVNIELIDVPQQTPANKKCDLKAEEIGVEDYSDQELNGPKAKATSKSKKDPRYARRDVPDKETENPKPQKAAKEHKENNKHTLYLCNECYKTFRNNEAVCLHCKSKIVEKVIKDGKVPHKDDSDEKMVKTLMEGVLELVGEIEGVSKEDQDAVRAAIESGKIPDEWPTEDAMIDELSALEDIVDPSELDEYGDLKIAYAKYVLVPKALSMLEGMKEDVDNTNTNEIIRIVNACYEGLEPLGYWHTETIDTERGTRFEFIKEGGGKVFVDVEL